MGILGGMILPISPLVIVMHLEKGWILKILFINSVPAGCPEDDRPTRAARPPFPRQQINKYGWTVRSLPVLSRLRGRSQAGKRGVTAPQIPWSSQLRASKSRWLGL